MKYAKVLQIKVLETHPPLKQYNLILNVNSKYSIAKNYTKKDPKSFKNPKTYSVNFQMKNLKNQNWAKCKKKGRPKSHIGPKGA